MRGKIRAVLVAFAAVAALTLGNASANVAAGCTGAQVWIAEGAQSRSCVATGGTRYAFATANAWTITVKRGATVIQSISSGPATPLTGTLSSKAGDVITVTTTSIKTAYGSVHTGFYTVA